MLRSAALALLLIFCRQSAAAVLTSDDFYEAIINDRREAIHEYLTSGGDPNALATHGDWSGTLLQLALQARREEIAFDLMNAGADPTTVEQALGLGILELALMQGMEMLVADLHTEDPEVLIKGDPSDSPLIDASADGRYNAVLRMLKRANEHRLEWGGRLELAFQAAASEGHEDIARVLLDDGADPRADPALLHAAVWGSNSGLVRDLIAAGAPLAGRVNGSTTVDVAVKRMERKDDDGWLILRELVDEGADACYLVEGAGRFSALTLRELRSAAPQCDWPEVRPNAEAARQP